MDSTLLLAFLAFGAACSSLWAWLIATAGEQREAMESFTRIDPNSTTPPRRR
jgi:HAMP domain-containing protein